MNAKVAAHQPLDYHRAMMDRQGRVGSSSDSLLEGTGFELSVPREIGLGYEALSFICRHKSPGRPHPRHPAASRPPEHRHDGDLYPPDGTGAGGLAPAAR